MRTMNDESSSGSIYSPRSYDFFLLGIGSSNGGIEPLKAILARLPADIQAAVIVIHHGPLETSPGLAQTLRAVTSLPVIQVDSEERVRPGHIYVLPPNEAVKLRDYVLRVEPGAHGRKTSRVIDILFRSLAYEARDKSICAILSGAGYDGLEGAIAVEQHGGLVIVQDPATATFPMMPVTTIANDDPSFILNPEEIGDLINSYLGK